MAEIQVPSAIKEVAVESLYEAMKRVTDKRSRRGRQYPAAVVLTLLVLTKLAGGVKLKGNAEWVGWQAEMLAQRLPLYRGKVPCANTYRYVSDHIEVVELNRVLGEYFAEVTGQAKAGTQPTEQATEGCAAEQAELTHLALDGKNLCGVRRSENGSKVEVHTVGLDNVTANFMWKQQSVMGKGQERKAALALLAPLALQGSVVSADASHTQPKWAKAVLEQGGEYLLIAKGNQSELREAIALLFSQPPRPRLFPEGEARTVDKAHGRLEVRHLRVSSKLSPYLAPRWPQVAQVFQIERTITCRGKTTREMVYGLTSLTSQQASPASLPSLVRQHWHIENRNHWPRHVTLGEDACRVSTGQVPQVLAPLNNCVLALVDFLQLPNLAPATRFFNARPQMALDLRLLPLSVHQPSKFV